MKKKILYIGNQLAPLGKNATTIDTLTPLFGDLGFEIVAVSSFENKFLKMLHMLWSVVKCRNYDYLLIDTYSTSNFYYALFCSQLARVFGLKYIPILHGGNLEKRLIDNPKLSRLIFNNASVNVTPSLFLREIFERNGYVNLIHIPNSIELEKYIYKYRNEFKPKLMWVRALADVYNPMMALKVLKALQIKFPDASLTMVGPDKENLLNSLEEYCKVNNLNVKFTGKVSKEKIIDLAQEHDIFINTSRLDNLPVSILEAMALHLPIVSTNVGGIGYLLENEKDSFLVGDNDDVSMVERLVFSIENPIVVNKMLENASLKIKQFNWKIVSNKWLELLK